MSAIRAKFIRDFDGKEYVLSDQDVAWAARALWGEKHAPKCPEKEAAAILWTWLNRFMLWPGGMKKWGSLKSLILAHSQPVNPSWRRNGKFCLPGGKGYDTQNCSPNKLQWRDKMADTPLELTPIRLQRYANQFAAGELPHYSYVDFASNAYAVSHGVQVSPEGEHFLVKSQTRMPGWKPGSVQISGFSTKGGGWGIIAAAGAGVIAAGWAIKRLVSGRPKSRP